MSQFERFGKYILLEKLATGGMAEIYLAKSLGAQGVTKFLAVKRILPQFSEKVEYKDMFREEAKVSVNLRHSNVVPIFDFGEEKGQFYLVMDYVEGRNLRQILNDLKKQQVQLSVEQISYIIREAAGGLDHAHRCIDGSTGRPLNIIHRDISPQNVMISFEGEVKIIDFGIAKAETQLEATQAGTLKGKFGYMSPEQADGLKIDVRTDIFSLGIILWELLANDRLFTASSEAAILRKIRDCQVPPIRKINPNVPPELEKIVNKVLAKDPNLRYQTAAALHKDLNRFLNTIYPDFNAQDFAIFVKNAFSGTYQELKQKLVGYADINASDAIESTPPGGRPPAPPNRGETIIDRSIPREEEKLDLDTKSHVAVKLEDLNGAKSKIKPRVATALTPSGIPNAGTRSGYSANTGLPRKPFTPPKPTKKSSGGLMLPLSVAALALAGWFFWTNQTKKKPVADAPVTVVKKAPEIAAKPEVAEMASRQNFQVTISSDPPGARISIDCEDQRAYTPKVFNLEGNKNIHVTLRRDGFYPYEIDLNPVKDAQTLQARMQSLGRAAYISVSLFNGGSSPVLEINGRRVCEATSLAKYPIPADVPVQIRARNPATGAMAETTVTLQAEQKKEIELILGLRP